MKTPLKPTQPGDSGTSVEHLQDALRTMLEHGVIRSFNPPDRPNAEELSNLSASLAKERAGSRFGDATQALVLFLQVQQSLGDQRRGIADAETVALISKWIKQLAAGDRGYGYGESTQKSVDNQPDPAGDASVLTKGDNKTLTAALAAAADAGVPRDQIDLFLSAVDDLASLDQHAIDVLTGATWLDEITAVVDDFAPWQHEFSSSKRSKVTTMPALTLRSPGALPVAAYLAGAIGPAHGKTREFSPEAGLQRSRQAMTAFLWRAEPVARVVYAARAWADQRLGIEGFVGVLSGASMILRHPLNPKELVAALRNSLTVLPFPSPINPRDPLWPQRPPFWAWLLPENQAWAHCVFGLHQLFPPLPQIPKTAPSSGSISPSSICRGSIPGAGLEVQLHSPVSGSFGPREPVAGSGEMWGISVNGTAAQVVIWTNSEIRFVTTAYKAGCNKLSWTWASNWSPDNGVGAACSEALRIPPLRLEFGTSAMIASRTRFWIAPARDLVVVGPTVGQLTASAGTGGAPAEACTPVTVTWQVNGLDCLSARALATIQLVRERTVHGALEEVVLRVNANPQDTVTETLDTTATYRIDVTSKDEDGNDCGTTQASIIIARQKLIRLALPAKIFSGQPAAGRVSVSCPAPTGGLPVAFTVAPNGALTVPGVTIPEGDTNVSFTATAGTLCGPSSVTASAADHSPGAAGTCVLVAPTISSMTAPPAPLACTRFSISLSASCVTQTPALKAFAVAGSQRTPLTVSAPAGGNCGRNATLSLNVPELPSGTYSITLEDEGGSATAPQTVIVAPNPLIVSAPQTHNVNISGGRCPRPDTDITVTVRGANAVTFSYPHPDGTITRTVSGGSAGCGTWRATFTAVFDRTAIVTATPTLGSTPGPAVAIPVVLSFDPGVARSVSIFASDPAGDRIARAADIVRVETDLQTGMTTRTPDGSITNFDTRTFALAPCLVTVFEYSRPEVPDPISTSMPPFKIGPMSGASGPWNGHPEATIARDQA